MLSQWGAFTAVELDPRAVCTRIFWKYFIYMGLFWSRLLQVLELFSGYSFWSAAGGPEKDRNVCLFVAVGHYARSPRIRLANWMSLGIMVTLFA